MITLRSRAIRARVLVGQRALSMRLPEELGHLGNQFVARSIALAAVAATSALTPRAATAQASITESSCPDNTPAVFHRCALEAAESYEPPRTADGRPDLGGS